MTLSEKLCALQKEYVIGKKEYNEFGKFSYRNVEGMLSVLKPLLAKYKVVLTFNESIHTAADRIYIVSEAMLIDTESTSSFISRAFAREPSQKKGMDESQITGSTTSYARKSALAGLFAVDNGERDPDEGEDESKGPNDTECGLDAERSKLLSKIREIDPNAPKKMLEMRKANYFSDIPLEYYQKIYNAYQNRNNKKEEGNA